MVANCDQNSHQIKFWLLNNYKIEVMIKFSGTSRKRASTSSI